MGMSIDDALEVLEVINNKRESPAFVINGHMAMKIAVDTMRKYQKIAQILDEYDLESWEILEMIRKVVEDGKID